MLTDTEAADRRPLLGLLLANAISLAGNQITTLAIPWYVLASGGSASQVGIVGFFTVLPTVIAAFFGGGLVDWIGRKRISIMADLLSGVTVLMIPLLHSTIGLAFWQLLVLVFCGALLDAPGTTARQSLMPDLIERAQVTAERANSAYQTVYRFSQLVGPVAGGLLIAVLGATGVLWIDAISFAISAVLIARLIPHDPGPRRTDQNYLIEMREGLAFIGNNRLLLWLGGMLTMMNLFDAPFYGIILPLFSNQEYGNARALGLMFGALGAGSVIGTILFGIFGAQLPRSTTIFVSFALTCVPHFVLASFPALWVALLALTFCGVASGPLNPLLMTIRQEQVPDQLRARVFGAFTAIAWCAIPFGMLFGGVVINAIGIRAGMLAIGSLQLLTLAAMIASPALRLMDRKDSSSSPVNC